MKEEMNEKKKFGRWDKKKARKCWKVKVRWSMRE